MHQRVDALEGGVEKSTAKIATELLAFGKHSRCSRSRRMSTRCWPNSSTSTCMRSASSTATRERWIGLASKQRTSTSAPRPSTMARSRSWLACASGRPRPPPPPSRIAPKQKSAAYRRHRATQDISSFWTRFRLAQSPGVFSSDRAWPKHMLRPTLPCPLGRGSGRSFAMQARTATSATPKTPSPSQSRPRSLSLRPRSTPRS